MEVHVYHAASCFFPHRSAGRGPGADLPDGMELPEGVDMREIEEARMLEAAMLGIPYEGRMPDFSNRYVHGVSPCTVYSWISRYVVSGVGHGPVLLSVYLLCCFRLECYWCSWNPVMCLVLCHV